jgi:glycosyltransferase involved in cell wall biosynthesis
VNDGGADISSILHEFEPKLSIQYIANERSKGRSAALNRGITASRGSWVGYLDDDDILYPTHLELMARATRDHTDTPVVYADTNRALCHVGEDADIVICRMPLQPFEFDRSALLIENRIPILSVLHSRDCFERVGVFNEEIDLLEDWDFWLRLSQRYKFVRLPRITAEYRFRVSATLENSITSRRIEAMEAMLKTYERYPVNDPFLQKKRETIIEEMKSQISDLAKIQEMSHDDIKKSYLTICRVAGFVPSEIQWTGYRA